MPALTKRATVQGNVVSTWTGIANAVDTGSATFAQWAVTTANATGSVDLSGFDFSALPANATINSVNVAVKGYVSNTTRMLAPLAEAFVGGSSRGGQRTLAPHGTNSSQVYTAFPVSMTLAELLAGTLMVRFTARRSSNTSAATTYLDHIEVTVDYSVPVAGISTLVDDFANGVAPKWPGSYGSIATANGEAVITTAAVVYSAVFTDPVFYDARNGEFSVRVRLPGPGAGGREFGVELRIDSNNFLQFFAGGFPGTLYANLRQAGVTTGRGSVVLTQDTFWVKFSMVDSVVTFSYSTDRTNWQVLGTGTPSWSLASVAAHLFVGAWQAEGTFDVGFGYVNTSPPAPPPTEKGEIWNGTRWVAPEIWNGTRWVPGSQAEVWNGTRWVPFASAAAVPTTTFWNNNAGGTPGDQVPTGDNGSGSGWAAASAGVLYGSPGRFDSVGVHIAAGSGSGLLQWNNPSATAKAAVGLWVKPGALPSTDGRLVDLRNTPSAGTVGGIIITPTTPRLRIMDTSIGLSTGQSPVITVGEWYWVSLGWDATAKTAQLTVHDAAGALVHDSGLVATTNSTFADLTTARFVRPTAYDMGASIFDDFQFNIGSATPLPPWGV